MGVEGKGAQLPTAPLLFGSLAHHLPSPVPGTNCFGVYTKVHHQTRKGKFVSWLYPSPTL